MRVLALDTTTNPGSSALVDDDRVIDERSGDATRSHAERFPGELEALLNASGLAWADVDLFAVASGPGSFTGLRIGIATIQGLSFVTRRRVVAVPALDALAQLGSDGLAEGSIVAAIMNAHRRDVFTAVYEVTAAPMFDHARLITRDAAGVDDPDTRLSGWSATLPKPPDVVIGDGAVLYEGVVRQRWPGVSVRPAPMLAGAIGRIAVLRARRGDAVDPAAIQPLYVRRPDAEIDREKRTSGRS